jgi:hypothetical protein
MTHAYFMNEAADVFAWLMGMANQMEHETGYKLELGCLLEDALWAEYPGECRYCHSELCKCPPILSSTVGRLSKEMPLSAFSEEDQTLFSFDEAIQHFRIGEVSIRVGTEEIQVTPVLLQEISTTSQEMLAFLKEHKPKLESISVELSQALVQLHDTASMQQVSQQSIDEILVILKDMSPEPRSLIIDFLNNFAAGIWLEVLLKAVGS